jgi:membrane protein YdbS with pleckstrin-like domain
VFVIIVALVTIGSTRSAIHADFPAYSASRVHKAAVALVVYEVVIQVITIGLWRRDSSTYLAASKAR